MREEGNYDGGLKSAHVEQLKAHRKEMEELAAGKSRAHLESIAEAAAFIEYSYSNN